MMSGRVEALTALAPHLQGAMTARGMEIALTVRNETRRGEVLAALAPCLTEELLIVAITKAIEIDHIPACANALIGLLERCSEEQRTQYLPTALEATLDIGGDDFRTMKLALLAPYLGGPLLDRALNAEPRIVDGEWQAEALETLALHSSGDRQDALLASARLGSAMDQGQIAAGRSADPPCA